MFYSSYKHTEFRPLAHTFKLTHQGRSAWITPAIRIRSQTAYFKGVDITPYVSLSFKSEGDAYGYEIAAGEGRYFQNVLDFTEPVKVYLNGSEGDERLYYVINFDEFRPGDPESSSCVQLAVTSFFLYKQSLEVDLRRNFSPSLLCPRR